MKAWNAFLYELEAEIGEPTVQQWLRSLKVLRYDAENLYLEARDAFQVMWFEEHVREKVLERLVNNNQRKIKVHIALSGPTQEKINKRTTKEAPPKFRITFDSLEPYCTFDNFTTSEDNELVHKLLQQITEGLQDSAFNPLYIHGKDGSGKSHLLMALAETLTRSGTKALYTRTETFTDHVIAAIRAGEMSAFRQAYRSADVLIVDDVHILAKKAATQEEFFHTFNTLHMANKQIILSANCPPSKLQMIEPRLVSRFEWGIVLPLAPLEKQDAKKALIQRAELLKFDLPAKVADFLVDTFHRNHKTLNQALEALILRHHLDSARGAKGAKVLTALQTKGYLEDLINAEEQHILDPDKILQAVTSHYGIRREDVLGKAQTRECVLPRQLAMFLCRSLLKLPFTKIGEIFGRDHSTVMTSVKRIQKQLDENDAEVVEAQQEIVGRLGRV